MPVNKFTYKFSLHSKITVQDTVYNLYNVHHSHNNPKSTQSIRAGCIISFMLPSVFKWTGKVITKSHVDVVGLHLQPGLQP
jgi:hypothetical protein